MVRNECCTGICTLSGGAPGMQLRTEHTLAWARGASFVTMCCGSGLRGLCSSMEYQPRKAVKDRVEQTAIR